MALLAQIPPVGFHWWDYFELAWRTAVGAALLALDAYGALVLLVVVTVAAFTVLFWKYHRKLKEGLCVK